MNDFLLKRENSPDIAYTFEQGERDLCVLYLHGWGANRVRPKALAVRETAQKMDCGYVSLDYTAHGDSGGNPTEFTVGQGLQDTLDILKETAKERPLLIVGNSIGGWIGLLLAESLKQTVGFMGLAPAPDITVSVWDNMIPKEAQALLEKGAILGPAPKTFGLCLTKRLFQEAKNHLMLHRDIDFKGPVRLLIGDKDDRVEWDRLLKIKDRLTSENVDITLIKGANHHLSGARDLVVIQRILENLLHEVIS